MRDIITSIYNYLKIILAIELNEKLKSSSVYFKESVNKTWIRLLLDGCFFNIGVRPF